MLVKSLGSGPGNLRYLSMTSVGKAGMVANPEAPLLGEVFTAWKWGKNPPPPPPPSAAQVSVEYFIWGMHFVIPEPQLKIWENDLTTVHDVLEAAAPLAGDIPVVGEILEAVIDAAAAYIQEEVSLMKQADKGNGVYLSMCWFAIGLFFPTPI